VENRDLKRQQDQNWQQANRCRQRVYRRVSEAKRRAAPGSITAADVLDLKRLQRGKCAICRTKLTESFHLDHITPIVRQGANERRNAQLLCAPCNMRKHARDPIDHMRSLGLLL
jgi:5-methylcytosine-specific restriction endonuclease McrA